MEGLVNRKYQVVYADPPYKYRNVKTGGSMKSGANAKYPVMDIKYIQLIPVVSLTDINCACFLWIPVPLLPEGFSVLHSWGFDYKTAIFWRKIMSLGMGFWFRGQVEVCLLGIRGKVKAFRSMERTCYHEARTKHSQKPQYFYKLIETVTTGKRIELFARRARSGWSVWGNQAPKSV